MLKRWLLLLTLIVFLGLMPRGAWAYAADVHFNLTYVLCRLAGLDEKDALWVADADQSMDDNLSTSCFRDSFREYYNNRPTMVDNGVQWHDFNSAHGIKGTDTLVGYDVRTGRGKTIKYDDGGQAARLAIHKRLNELWNITLQSAAKVPGSQNENTRIMADIAMGQYLHTEQDYFSHRQFTPAYRIPDNSYTDNFPKVSFLPYGERAGHADDGDGHSADYVALRPALACDMAADSYRHIRQYVAAVNGDPASPEVLDPAMVKALNLLVFSIARTYTTPKSYTADYYRKSDTAGYELHPNTDFKIPPNTILQIVVNTWLTKALIRIPAAIKWRTLLPKNADTLPDDNPIVNTALENALKNAPTVVTWWTRLPKYTYTLPYDDNKKTPLYKVKSGIESMMASGSNPPKN